MSSRLPASERRQQLLDTALATFARLGYRDAAMNDIADAAGVTKPVLYQHFASKRELFLELLADVASRLRLDSLLQAYEQVATNEARKLRKEIQKFLTGSGLLPNQQQQVPVPQPEMAQAPV